MVVSDRQLQALMLGRRKGIKRSRPSGLKYTLHKDNPTWYKKNDPRIVGNQYCKGRKPWNKDIKGLHLSSSTEFKKGENIGEKNNKWKGESVSYQNLHGWLRRNYKKTGACKNCNKEAKTQWANISQQYKRTIKDFIELCPACHVRYDKGLIYLKHYV